MAKNLKNDGLVDEKIIQANVLAYKNFRSNNNVEMTEKFEDWIKAQIVKFENIVKKPSSPKIEGQARALVFYLSDSLL